MFLQVQQTKAFTSQPVKPCNMKPSIIFLLLAACLFIFFSCTKTGMGGGGMPSAYTSDVAGGGGSDGSTGDTIHPSGVLTAGEWNDNDHWDFWLNLMANDTFSMAQQTWGFACTARWNFMVKDANNNPVSDAVITIKQDNNVYWVCRTNKFGTARFLPVYVAKQPITQLTWQVSYNGNDYTAGDFSHNTDNINCTLPVAATQKDAVDIMLVVDATGSMGDEIEYLKDELYDVLNRTEAQLSYADLRYSAVFYRDYGSGDEYVTRPHEFTSNKNEIVQFVTEQSADGGGDFPEAVDKALETAMQQQWSADAKARIMFLILDAPPHETPESLDLVQASIQKAAEKGITIIPIAASGIDKPTEFLLRFMSITTNGTYTFLTNDSGVGNDHITPTVGPYTVEYLNNLMVRLITKYAGR